MSNDNKVFVSPGVYTSERDLSFVTQSIGVTTLGIVGETTRGPAFEPILVRNFDEFRTFFGGTSPEKYVGTQIPKYEASYIAKEYLTQSNQLFITRVLGLSGYDAGPSWSIKVTGNVDPDTIESQGFGSTSTFSAEGSFDGGFNFTNLPQSIKDSLDDDFTTFDGSTTTLRNEMNLILQDIITQNNLQSTAVFGAMSGQALDDLGIVRLGNQEIDPDLLVNVFGVEDVEFENIDLTQSVNDVWFYSQFELNNDDYVGKSFAVKVDSFNDTDPENITVELSLIVEDFEASPFEDYHNLVVATLRSRGIAFYNGDNGVTYEVEAGNNNVEIDCDNQYGNVISNPFSEFAIKVTNIDNDEFVFKTSFDSSNSNYINKVFGRDNFGRQRKEVPLMVEEVYANMLTKAFRKGKIRGVNCDILELDSAVSTSSDSIGWYLDRYQGAETPYLVSEVRGDETVDLFKFLTIADGNTSNTQVKVSITNISFSDFSFDVIVRDFFDTDNNPTILERFTRCNMNPNDNGYIGKKIGTDDGLFENRSRYITVSISEDAPSDALPCGFRGYDMRNYATAKAPFLNYKDRYFKPGDVVFDPPFGNVLGGSNVVISAGDRIRRTYLGVSDTVGIDSDFLQYKGKQNVTNIGFDTEGATWSIPTKGFHMDINADEDKFVVGEDVFDSEPTNPDNVYSSLSARKFTIAFKGGFDGWDIYRETRTNTDRFMLGGQGFLDGAAQSINYPNANGWGAFKTIVSPEKDTWANTDYYAFLKGQRTFANPEDIDINVFVTPGIDYQNNSNLVSSAVDMVERDRADSIYITTSPDYNLFTESLKDFTSNFIFPEEAVDILDESGIDSNYTATYYPWVLKRDSVNNTQIFLPPTADVVKNIALTDNVSEPWFATAGYSRGLVNSIRARKKLTLPDRDILYKDRINPIATFSDVGTVIWGNKTLQRRESALDRLNVRRLLLRARKLISAVGVRLLFDPNDRQVRQEFEDLVNPILDNIRRERGLTDFRVVTEQTPEDMDNNQLIGKIYIKPTRALEFIDIEFLITPTGASFEDI